jgi:RNA polymerase sigma factor (sigma-70 family)
MKRNSCSDRDLIHLFMNGDEAAFECLVNRHKGKIFTTIYMFVKDHDLANDIFQETFIKIIDTIRSGRYNDEGKFIHWAVRIAHNLCVDNFRKVKRRPTVSSTDEFDIFDVVHIEEEPEEEKMIRNQTYEKIRMIVDCLPDEQREVIVLRHYAEMSFKEISEMTNVSINTALGRMRYALINIRKILVEKQICLY